MRKLIAIIYTALIGLLVTGCGADSAMRKGDKFYALGEYNDAADQYKKAYSQTKSKDKPLRGQRALKLADCYRRINYTQKAIGAYQNAVRFKQADSTAMLHLGRLQLKNGSYKEAEKIFKTLEDSMPRNILVKNGLQSAQMAPKWKAEAQYSGYTVKKQDLFNSRRSEYSPMLAGDDYNQLYFSSTRSQAKGDELSGITGTKNADIFFSQKDDKGKWSKPEVIETDLNTEFDEGACVFTPDFKTMYLTVCKTDPEYPRFAQIATAQRSDASWGKATELEITKDTLSTFAHPAISPDGMWLYFVSDMPGGLGGYDIWRVEITAHGLNSLENLGAPINTPGNEMFPTFRPNGDLYFSSDGHPGFGGLDIFIASPNKDGVYVIEHPGAPLNSQGDDFGMTFEGLHNRGYFSSNRGDARGWDHIYSFEKQEVVQTVKGWVYEKDGYELPEALVYMVGNDGTNKKLSVKGDGSFTELIDPNVDYVFLGTCKGYLNHTEELRVEPVLESEEYVLQFPLASLTAPVLIRNIFYDFDKATLRPESTMALDSLIELLNENANITIELSAHTDYRGSAAYNERLSQRRAESVVNYLIEHGIAADRLKPVGYGKMKPKTVKRKLTETYPWLKEGDVLTEEFIKALDEEKQEICNQLNRRTEFTVLRTTYGMDAKSADAPSSEPVQPQPGR
ncbi:OmpA family protein [Prevotella communis]|uniref:PorE family type IX secretion system protein n=1 Tax=Prevotella communis TaxID=2913614 RepID=UPI001EDAF8DF|nr:OmpA family protein [Prevotella communis]UKK57587.1 OmpA family protein [Prevotella communis]UKK63016.1 OmpA family protein [Prevotella communis]UKK65841.1 OmpA family protein [Prevotella communis]